MIIKFAVWPLRLQPIPTESFWCLLLLTNIGFLFQLGFKSLIHKVQSTICEKVYYPTFNECKMLAISIVPEVLDLYYKLIFF